MRRESIPGIRDNKEKMPEVSRCRVLLMKQGGQHHWISEHLLVDKAEGASRNNNGEMGREQAVENFKGPEHGF